MEDLLGSYSARARNEIRSLVQAPPTVGGRNPSPARRGAAPNGVWIMDTLLIAKEKGRNLSPAADPPSPLSIMPSYPSRRNSRSVLRAEYLPKAPTLNEIRGWAKKLEDRPALQGNGDDVIRWPWPSIESLTFAPALLLRPFL